MDSTEQRTFPAMVQTFSPITLPTEHPKILTRVLDEIGPLAVRMRKRMMFPAIALDEVKLKVFRRTAERADRAELTKQKRSQRVSTLRACKLRHTNQTTVTELDAPLVML